MSHAVKVGDDTAIGKARRPWAVAMLCVLTLGIYACVWYYKINREVRDYGSARGDRHLAHSKPARSVWPSRSAGCSCCRC